MKQIVHLFTLLFFSFMVGRSQDTLIIQESPLNYLLSKYYAKEYKNPSKGRYLMITPPEFESTLTYFANYKRNIGFAVQVVNTNTTGMTAKNIKNYIQTQYNNHSTRPNYVLLVGDVDKIPAFEGNASAKVKNDPITDLGYALLEGKDFLPNVYLGRFSVIDENQLKNIINKTIFMEVNMHLFDKKAAFLAGDEKKGVWNRSFMLNSFMKGHNYVIDNTFNKMGFECLKLYQTDKKTAVKALNDNPLYYIYAGHGNFSSLSGKSFDIGYSEIKAAKNKVFPLVFSFSCKSGNFAQTCVGEMFIREKNKGAVAFFGSSVNSQTNTDLIIEKKIFGNTFKQKDQTLSAIINSGMKQFASATSVRKKIRETFMKAYNLLGDPSLDLKGLFDVKKSKELIDPEQFSVFQNPRTNEISLAYTLDKNSAVQIDLLNISEELVKNILTEKQQKAGVYYYNFSLVDLPSGEYELIFNNSTIAVSSKIIIL